jgi:hypothetical protein
MIDEEKVKLARSEIAWCYGYIEGSMQLEDAKPDLEPIRLRLLEALRLLGYEVRNEDHN